MCVWGFPFNKGVVKSLWYSKPNMSKVWTMILSFHLWKRGNSLSLTLWSLVMVNAQVPRTGGLFRSDLTGLWGFVSGQLAHQCFTKVTPALNLVLKVLLTSGALPGRGKAGSRSTDGREGREGRQSWQSALLGAAGMLNARRKVRQ